MILNFSESSQFLQQIGIIKNRRRIKNHFAKNMYKALVDRYSIQLIF